MNTGEIIEPGIESIARIVITHNTEFDYPVYFTDKSFLHLIFVLNSAVFERMWDVMEFDKMSHEDRKLMTESFAGEFRSLIRKYTNIDTVKLAHDI
jgi:hypothetical protein